MISRTRRHVVGSLALMLLVGVPAASAQNTTTGSSYGYVVGQGPINIYIGNTGGTDTERWYTTALIQGKSYCFETFRGNSEYTIDVDLMVDVIRTSDSAVLYSFNNLPGGGDPSLGANSRWTRGCLCLDRLAGGLRPHLQMVRCPGANRERAVPHRRHDAACALVVREQRVRVRRFH